LEGLARGGLFFKKSATSAPLLKGPEYGPFSDSARLASSARRRAGVYSSSAVGSLERSIANWGVMTIFLPIARTSTKSPSVSPAAARTVLGDGHLAFVLDSNKCTHLDLMAGNPESPASCDVA
jgi:hypothetical protein